MDAVRARRERDVSAIVDEDLRRRGRCDHALREARQHATVQVPLAKLDHIDARFARFRSLGDEPVELGFQSLARRQAMSISDEANQAHGLQPAAPKP
jgi:hypothetical protein